MMKNQRTSWAASKTFLEGLGRAGLIVRIARNLSPIADVRTARAQIRDDQLLLPPRGYSFFSSAFQFSTTVTDSDDVAAVSIRSRLPSGATSQPKTCKPRSL